MYDLIKLIVRIVVTFTTMGFGIAIFFTSESDQMKMVGLSLVTTTFGAWVSMGSNRKRKKTRSNDQQL